MPAPVLIEIRPENGVWEMRRDGKSIRSYGHADLAVHDAVRMAHDLIHTGEPASVMLQAADGRMIAVELDEPQRAATPGEDESSAVQPGRGPSA